MKQVIPLTLSSDPTTYVVPDKVCRCVNALSVVTTDITVNNSTITLSDGTTTIGTLTVATGSVAGTIDTITIDTTSLGKVALGPDTPLKIVCTGTPTAGACNLTLVFDEFHANN